MDDVPSTQTVNEQGSAVQVFVRFRPLLDGEPGAELTHFEGTSVTLCSRRPRVQMGVEVVCEKQHVYHFNHVFDVSADNPTVYLQCIHGLVENVIQCGGQSACFAYGYTGTGKSTTIYGSLSCPRNSEGLAAIAAMELLAEIKKLGPTYGLRVSMCEVAGNQCFDLLSAPARAPLKVRHNAEGCVSVRSVQGGCPLTRCVVRSKDDFDALLARGAASRRVGSSTVHDESSRSHAVIEFDVVNDQIVALESAVRCAETAVMQRSNERDDELRERAKEAMAREGPAALGPSTELGRALRQLGQYHNELSHEVDAARQRLVDAIDACGSAIVRGRLAFVDMAGNDWEQATDVQTRISRAEQAEINSALLAVKECLRAIHVDVENKKKRKKKQSGKSSCSTTIGTKGKTTSFVPFRNSVLTHLLQRYFTASTNNARLCMIATATPSDDARLVLQSVNTLNYAKLLQS